MAALQSALQHLCAGGVFAFSIPNPNIFEILEPQAEPEVEEIFPHPLDGEPVQVSSGWQRTRHYFTIYWHYDHLLPDGHIQRTNIQVKHYRNPYQVYLEELQAQGFKNLTVLGDFDRSPYSQDSNRLIVLASTP
jgi:hypothetical protein